MNLQHTITGWPAASPMQMTPIARTGKPFPKRVVVFSPHPDDDVISMGGTLRRLVQQGHEVHVAYETSGNIAVGDEEVVRFHALHQRFQPTLMKTPTKPSKTNMLKSRNSLPLRKKAIWTAVIF